MKLKYENHPKTAPYRTIDQWRHTFEHNISMGKNMHMKIANKQLNFRLQIEHISEEKIVY